MIQVAESDASGRDAAAADVASDDVAAFDSSQSDAVGADTGGRDATARDTASGDRRPADSAVDDVAGSDRNAGNDRTGDDRSGGSDGATGVDHSGGNDSATGVDRSGGNDSATGVDRSGGSDRATGADRPQADACPAALLGDRLGRSHLLVGGSMADSSFEARPFDLNYRYLAGAVPEGGTCGMCTDASCSTGGLPCSDNSCAWWGCWQWVVEPPGRYVANLIDYVAGRGSFPMITYYVWYSVAGNVEGAQEVTRLNEAVRLRPYLQDFRFLCQVIGEQPATPTILHLEPDLWGYGEQVDSDPAQIPVALASAGITECNGQPNNLVGLAHCLLILARQYAPNALVGFHASAWGAGADAIGQPPTFFDVVEHAHTTAAFYRALGADAADLVVVEMSDRDAGFYQTVRGEDRWWDPLNVTPPHFHQAQLWVDTLSRDLGLAALWWQVPLGNMSLNNTPLHYRDNRLDYFFDHPAEFAAGNAIGIAFGSGGDNNTTVESDSGHFLQRAGQYYGSARPRLCGP